ncbi:hypothetical protein ACJX0J_012373 [Zea mays]
MILLSQFRDLRAEEKMGKFHHLPKRDATILKRKLSTLQRYLGGIKYMTRLPDIVIVLDQQKEYIALQECAILGIPTISLVDTNCDPDLANISIPANDDTMTSIRLILNKLNSEFLSNCGIDILILQVAELRKRCLNQKNSFFEVQFLSEDNMNITPCSIKTLKGLYDISGVEVGQHFYWEVIDARREQIPRDEAGQMVLSDKIFLYKHNNIIVNISISFWDRQDNMTKIKRTQYLLNDTLMLEGIIPITYLHSHLINYIKLLLEFVTGLLIQQFELDNPQEKEIDPYSRPILNKYDDDEDWDAPGSFLIEELQMSKSDEEDGHVAFIDDMCLKIHIYILYIEFLAAP